MPPAAKHSPHGRCREPLHNLGMGNTAKRMDSSALINANSSWLAAHRRFHTHSLSRTGIPPGTGAFRTLLLHRVTYRLQFLLALQSGLWTGGRTLQTDPTKKQQPYPPNIVSVTAAPLIRVFLARFSNLKDTLGKISSYDKVILSLLCCSRYTSP